MTEKLRRKIAEMFYQESLTKEELIKEFNIRPKTLNKILNDYKSEFVKES